MSNKLFVVTGASGSGKTTLLNNLMAEADINIKKAPKYSTRKVRNENDDIIYSKTITRKNFDLVYKLNEKTYGIKIDEIRKLLKGGTTLFIILSDIRVIKRLKKELKDLVVTLYISSAIDETLITKIQNDRYKKDFKLTVADSEKLYRQFLKLKSAINLNDWNRLFDFMGKLMDDWSAYLPERNSTEIRKTKIRDFHKMYIDNINLFDHVILNHNYNDPHEMTHQVKNLLLFYKTNSIKVRKKKPPVFIVSAASGSGKGMLMESIQEVIGIENIKITNKMAKRSPKKSDKQDGMKAIGKDGEFDEDFNLRWTFHKGEFHTGTEYAVSEKEIKTNIQQGIPQIFVSNTEQVNRFKNILEDNAVFIYLHATRSDEEIKNFQYKNCKTEEEAKQRLKEIDDVHNSYINQIFDFDHVLLNTAYPEDMYEQMFTLIDHYTNEEKLS